MEMELPKNVQKISPTVSTLPGFGELFDGDGPSAQDPSTTAFADAN